MQSTPVNGISLLGQTLNPYINHMLSHLVHKTVLFGVAIFSVGAHIELTRCLKLDNIGNG